MTHAENTTVRLVVDTSSNVPEELLQQHRMIEVATSVLFGTDEFRLKRDIDLEQFYRELERRPEHPTTSQPTPQQFTEAYAQALAEGAATVLCIVVSSKLSGTFNSARLAAEEFDEGIVQVWDSQGVSMTSGLQALAAANLLAQGHSLTDCLRQLADLRTGIQGYLTVENLDTLARSGRVSALQKNMGNVLNLKPILAVEEGAVIPVGKARGREKAKRDIMARMQQAMGDDPAVVAVSHADAAEEAAAFLDQVQDQLQVAESHLMELDPAIVALGGKGILGLAGYRAL